MASKTKKYLVKIPFCNEIHEMELIPKVIANSYNPYNDSNSIEKSEKVKQPADFFPIKNIYKKYILIHKPENITIQLGDKYKIVKKISEKEHQKYVDIGEALVKQMDGKNVALEIIYHTDGYDVTENDYIKYQ
jgi:hypothetical protein